jgi:type I restriction enzyme, S subunit
MGAVPTHWNLVPLKAAASHNDEILDETTPANKEILYVDISGVDGVAGIRTKESMLFGAAPSRARRRVKDGDVLVSTVRTYLRAIVSIHDPEENLVVSTGFAVLRSRGALIPAYFGYLLSSHYFVDEVIARSTGVSYPAINASELVTIPVAIPPSNEQVRIAAFLNAETAKIDALIAEQLRLIELLKEKRHAAISHAVTKGLNPDAPLKPSGVEWLGDVPAHWDVQPVKSVAKLFGRIGYRGYTTADLVDEGDGAISLSPSNMTQKGMSLSNCTYISWAKYQESPEITIDVGDIVMVKTGSTLGKLAFVTEVPHPMTINPQLVIYKQVMCSSRFLFFTLSIPTIQALIEIGNTGSSIPTVTQELLGNCVIAIPPRREQIAITAHIDSELNKVAALIQESERGISLLQERRTALISAAVTGKIDVRNYASSEAA